MNTATSSPTPAVPLLFQWDGPLDPDQLTHCLTDLVNRHDVFRSANGSAQSSPLFSVQESTHEGTESPVEWALTQIADPTTIEHAIRVAVRHLGTDQHLVLIGLPGQTTDPQTARLFGQELMDRYIARHTHQPYANEDPGLTYADLLDWQQKLPANIWDKGLHFWRKQFPNGLPDRSRLCRTPNSANVPFRAGYLGITLTSDVSAEIMNLGQQSGLPVGDLLLAAYTVLLYRHTQQPENVVGLLVPNRNQPGTERLFGPLANRQPIRTEINSATQFLAFAKTLNRSVERAKPYQSLPTTQLEQVLASPNQTGTIANLFQYAPQDAPAATTSCLSIKQIETNIGPNDYSLSLLMSHQGDRLTGSLAYNRAVVSEAEAAVLMAQFETLLGRIVANPNGKVADFSLLGNNERQQLLRDWVPQPEPISALSFVEQLSQRVTQTPDAVALRQENRNLTYAELWAQSGRVAGELLARLGNEPGGTVALLMQRSEWLMVGLLGIIRAGKTLLPIDPATPSDRLNYLLTDASVGLLLTDTATTLTVVPPCPNLFLRDAWNELNVVDPVPVVPPADVAYLIYTSGSTGRPKGVAVGWNSLLNYVAWANAYYYGNQMGYPFGLCTSVAFDLTFTGIFTTLLRGDTLIVAEEADVDVVLTGLFSPESGIRATKITPAHISLLGAMNLTQTGIEHVIVGGEALTNRQIQTLQKLNPAIQIFNEYGPTEATIGCTVQVVSDEETLHIGKPIRNARLYVLDDQLQPVAIGQFGELCIGGACLALGYHNQPELTNQKFVPLPFDPTTRVYRSGDLGRWRADGTLELRGRADYQVKIQGYRVELGEIEQVLLQVDGVEEAAVLYEKIGDDSALIGFIRTAASFDQNKLLAHLQQTMPTYMIPGQLIPIEQFPLTTNGKVDRAALAQIASEPATPTNWQANGLTEQTVARVWAELLGKPVNSPANHFFRSGGNSLKAIQLIARLHEATGVRLDLRQLFSHPTLTDLVQLIDSSVQSPYQPIEPVPVQPDYALSDAQRQVWALHQLDSTQYAFNMPSAFLLNEAVDADALDRAILAVVNRHESLRTTFPLIEGEPRQQIQLMAQPGAYLTRLDLRHQPDHEAQARLVAQRVAFTPFDLEKGPLLRATLAQLDSDRFLLAISIHHIIADEWSLQVFWQEVYGLYSAEKQGVSHTLPALPIQYKDYAAWQQQQVSGERATDLQTFWQQTLAGPLPVLNLPLDHPRPAQQTFNGMGLALLLDAETTTALRTLSDQHGASLFMTMVAAVDVLLYRYTGQTDLLLGTTIANRPHPALDNQIGFYVNTLVLRTQLTGEEGFSTLLQRVQTQMTEAYAHQQYPFDRLFNDLQLPRLPGRAPLFDVLVEQAGLEPTTTGAQPTTNPDDFAFGYRVCKHDLVFRFTPIGDQLRVVLEYNTDLFAHATIASMGQYFQNLLGLVAQPNPTAIARLPYLPADEVDFLTRHLQDTRRTFAPANSIIELMEQQAERSPQAIALHYGPLSVSYAELNRQANQLAHALLTDYGLQPGDRVGLLVPPSDQTVLAILAILKAGATFVPLDVTNPAERTQRIVEDAGLMLLITDTANWFTLNGFYQGAVFALDAQLADLAGADTNLPAPDGPIAPAYMIYTSGSTGQPKGVVVSQQNLLNYVQWANEYYFRNETGHCFALFGPLAFDLTLTSLFTTLLRGDALYISESTDITEQIREFFGGTTPVNTVKMTPSHVDVLAHLALPQTSVTSVILGGEALRTTQVALLKDLNPAMRIFNEYGPTEATIGCTVKEVDTQNPITIGRPIANARVYVLDANGLPVPMGVTGELYLAGDCVTEGYWQRSDLTEARFGADPFVEGARMYRSGDLGRLLPDGELLYLGRADNQVKIRGHRIELGEIETALSQYPGLDMTVVLAKPDETGNLCLVAYVQAPVLPTAAEIRHFLRKSMPDYMIPTQVVGVDVFPLTPNGKLDLNALPNPITLQQAASQAFVALSTATERTLAEIWMQVLQQQEPVSAQANFFDLGGHSLKAIQVAARVQNKLGVKLELKDIFAQPVLQHMAALIDQLSPAQTSTSQLVPSGRHYDVSPAQKRLWSLHQIQPDLAAYNQPGAYILDGPLDIEALRQTLLAIVQRHESLRTRFVMTENGLKQNILPASQCGFDLNIIDLRQHEDPRQATWETANQVANEPFDLTGESLFRAYLIRATDEQAVMVLIIHHIVSDGWSLNVLIHELTKLYLGFDQGQPITLPPLAIQYRDYVAWHQAQLAGPGGETDRQYWLDTLSGDLPVLALPTRQARPRLQTFRGASLDILIDKPTTERLKQFSRDRGGSLFMSLVAVVNVLLYKYTGQTDILLGTDTAGRTHQDMEQSIGFFLDALLLRNRLAPDEPFSAFFDRVRQQTFDAYEHQLFPYDQLIDELGVQRDPTRNPLFDVLIILQNFQDRVVDMSIPTAVAYGLGVQALQLEQTNSLIDLEFSFTELPQGLNCALRFNTDLFDADWVKAMGRHLTNLIAAVLAAPDRLIGQYDLLGPAEKQALIRQLAGPAVPRPANQTLTDLLTAKTYSTTAVRCGQKMLTYDQLHTQSNQLAHYLRTQFDLQPDERVGICLPRTEQLIVTLLAVLKSGAAYVPIDPELPLERIRHMLDDSHCRLVLSNKALLENLPDGFTMASVMALEAVLEAAETGPTTMPETRHSPQNLAYVMYTSGSTGQPKGVMIDHRALADYVLTFIDHFGLNAADSVVQQASVSFDTSVEEIYPTLCVGGQLLIAKEGGRDVEALIQLIEDQEATILSVSPLVVNALNQQAHRLGSLRLLISGGDALQAGHIDNLVGQMRVFNTYGPTESTVCATYGEICSAEANPTIGKPIANRQLYLLNDTGQLVPPGVTGELAIAGLGLAKGYLNAVDATGSAFILNPFRPNGDRLYLTGDLVRLMPDGQLLFVGRKDTQVKVRGYRVELGEVEAALIRHPAVTEAVVLSRNGVHGSVSLTACLSTREPITPSELHLYLMEVLPMYAIPARFVLLEALPLTLTGKPDRQALTRLAATATVSIGELVPPETELEAQILEIWKAILQKPRIGIHDNLFELGGNSLNAIKIMSRIKKDLHIAVELKALFRNPTIASLAHCLETDYVLQPVGV